VVNGRFSAGHMLFDFLSALAQLDALPNDMVARCLAGDPIGFVDAQRVGSGRVTPRLVT
jgi:hypothetical protein